MTKEEFNKHIEEIMTGKKHLSYSSLKEFLKSPKHFYKYKTAQRETAAMNEGTILHKAILEPLKFDSDYWVFDDSEKFEELIKAGNKSPRATKAYKDYKAGEIFKNAGKEIITKEFHTYCIQTREYLKTNSATKKIMAGLKYTEKEVNFEYDGIKMLCKIDGEGNDYTMDLKKVADASWKKLRWLVIDMLYDMQGAIYAHAAKKKKHILVFVDNDINVQVVEISPETLEAGFKKFEMAIDKFQSCAEEDLFQSSYEFYNNGFIRI